MTNLKLEIYVIKNLGEMSTNGSFVYKECSLKVKNFECFDDAMAYILCQYKIGEFEDMKYGKEYYEYALSVELVNVETCELVSSATYEYYQLKENK